MSNDEDCPMNYFTAFSLRFISKTSEMSILVIKKIVASKIY